MTIKDSLAPFAGRMLTTIKDGLGSFAGKILNSSIDDNGKFLFFTSAIGWLLASASQAIGLAKNKNIGKEEKKFLIPQEILDGAFNIASYAAITLPLMGVAKGAAEKFIPGNKPAADGARTIAAIAGGIISSNILTPILRNKSGAFLKKKMGEKKLEPPPPDIYDGRTYPNFRAGQPLSMRSYMNFTKNVPLSGSLKI